MTLPGTGGTRSSEFNAAYGGERMTAHVFLPKRSAPPFQTLILLSGHQRAAPAFER